MIYSQNQSLLPLLDCHRPKSRVCWPSDEWSWSGGKNISRWICSLERCLHTGLLVFGVTRFYLFGLVVSLFFVIFSPCFPLGHERPYACVDFQRSGSKELVDNGEPESTSESTVKQLPTRKPTEESIISTPTTDDGSNGMSSPTKEPVQYAVFCSLAHQLCPQGNDSGLQYFDIKDASSFSS